MNIWSARNWSRAELAERFASGQPFAADRLSGYVYRGLSLGLGRLIERLSWVQFAKAFTAARPGIVGWNIRCEQTGPDQPWKPRMRRGRPHTFGHFAVVDDDKGVELDYRDSALLKAVRDPLVSLSGPQAVLVLGRTELAGFGRRLVTPSYFVLERCAPVGPAWSP